MTFLKHIMLVDDDPASREIAKLFLERGGYKVTTCSSGAEALDKVEELAPQLVLLDVVMPDIDGIMLLNRLRRLNHGAPFPAAFITGRTQPEQINVYRNSGALGVITKPIDPFKILTEVAEIWDLWESTQPKPVKPLPPLLSDH
jgi:two-component system OmpR family response regulator